LWSDFYLTNSLNVFSRYLAANHIQMRIFFFLFAFSAICSSCLHTRTPKNHRKLIWSDEFNGTGLPDTTKWSYDLTDGCPKLCGWGNNENQYYTNRLENNRQLGGNLIIEARNEKMGTRDYTSTRLVTKNKGDWKYGRIEVRAKLPKGQGIWPAIWMLSTDWKYGGWPTSGEIDIMEHVGHIPDTIFSSLHTENFNWIKGTQSTNGVYCSSFSDSFHTYALDWDANQTTFLLDNKPFHTFHNTKKGEKDWPFDQPFHLILNIAVGGNWGGRVDDTIFPQQMLVDWVRVYQ
jgi:beta-glucanase (GH16 family)